MKKIYIPIGIGLAVATVFAFMMYSGLGAGQQQLLEDLLIPVHEPTNQTVLLVIDDASIERIGQWPWPREVFARVLNQLNNNQSQPKVVGLDVLFSEPSRIGDSDDEALAYAIKNAQYPIIVPAQIQDIEIRKDTVQGTGMVSTMSTIASYATVGHANLIIDSDGVARRFASSIATDDGEQVKNIKAFAVEVAEKATAKKITPPLKSQERIVFSGAPGTLVRIPFYRIWEGDASVVTRTKDKIVLIGATAPSLHDIQQVPVSRGIAMPGVEIQGNIVEMALKGHRLQTVSPVVTGLLIALAAIAAACFAFFFGLAAASIIAVGMVIVEVVLIAMAYQQGVVVNMLYIISVTVASVVLVKAYKYAVIDTRTRQIKKVFSKYVSPRVLEEILKNPEAVKLGGEEREMTVFFSDIRGFTTISEQTTPTELVRILNEYFTEMTAEVLRTGGVVDKYIGDAVMAFWGAPIDDPDHADHAVEAALAMIEKLKVLNKKLRAQGDPEIKIGIGLYSGKAVVGNVGSNDRFDYTVIGDTVNAASRLEGLNKEYKTQIIISETVKNKLKKQYPLVCLGCAPVKGRKEPINIYTIENTMMPPDEKSTEPDHKHH
ncbi:MAG: hypothetical protein RIQ54_324 [Candidatus Parcubacteria bacterium]|jgi:adenylate cyclase